MVARDAPVPCEVTVTVAPATAAPDLSVTVPKKLPVACPQAVEAKHIPSANARQAGSSFFMIFSLGLPHPVLAGQGNSQVEVAYENLQAKSVGRLHLKTQVQRLSKPRYIR